MNIQIFGISKSFDTKKAQRYFSERGIRVQYINLIEKPMSKGEFDSVKNAVGGIDSMIDTECKDKGLLSLVSHQTEYAKEETVFENQILIKLPVVRNSKKATVGYKPDVWKQWE